MDMYKYCDEYEGFIYKLGKNKTNAARNDVDNYLSEIISEFNLLLEEFQNDKTSNKNKVQVFKYAIDEILNFKNQTDLSIGSFISDIKSLADKVANSPGIESVALKELLVKNEDFNTYLGSLYSSFFDKMDVLSGCYADIGYSDTKYVEKKATKEEFQKASDDYRNILTQFEESFNKLNNVKIHAAQEWANKIDNKEQLRQAIILSVDFYQEYKDILDNINRTIEGNYKSLEKTNTESDLNAFNTMLKHVNSCIEKFNNRYEEFLTLDNEEFEPEYIKYDV